MELEDRIKDIILSSATIKEKIEGLLLLDEHLYWDLENDSISVEEALEIVKDSNKIYEALKTLDPTVAEILNNG
ncbi:hypothetical protein [uncultured Mediterranean phage uvMED]|nr:hypothetical protein [uncultured Mediterranean phage uvMED]